MTSKSSVSFEVCLYTA